MERLTKRKGRKTYVTKELCMLCAYDDAHKSTFCENTTCAASKDRTCPYLQVIDRLAAYEDTGLEPQEIAEMLKDRAHICAGAQQEERLTDKDPAAETELYEKAMLRLNRHGLKTRTQQIAYLEAEIDRYRAKIRALEHQLADTTDAQKLIDAIVEALPSLVQAIVEVMPQAVEAYVAAHAADPNKEG